MKQVYHLHAYRLHQPESGRGKYGFAVISAIILVRNICRKVRISTPAKKTHREAHEAIRPSDVNVMAESLKDMEADAQKLYQLIWRQFVACQMTPAKYDSTTLTVGAGDFRLKARGRILRFDGWTKVMPALRKGDEDRILPAVDKGDALTLVELTPAQHFTKPPARFSEASLVKELEKRGIGRPSTYCVDSFRLFRIVAMCE
ncbi:DNA topoisomerase I [Escherichia coli]|uniref:DNA topoisomerase I n=1 Tax=Escherichia coli TaxID=562 RepID=A0A377K797_ECOLX|nr:DNA topoisomerase I [Escherichia coli]